MSIPASSIVSVTPSVLSAGGNPLALNGLILSQSPRLPVGTPQSFPTLAAVQAYFGSYACSFVASCATNVLTVTAVSSGTLAVGQAIQGAGIPPGTYISALGTGIGGTGTYNLSTTPGTISSESMTSNCLEYQMAQVYFNGFNNSNTKPSALLFSRYASNPIPAFLRGALNSLTLAQLQAITTGTLAVTVDGTAKSAATVNLSTATSQSNAAALLTTALGLSGGAAVTWDSLASAFVITSGTTGATSTMTFCTGTVAAALGLDQASGGTLSQGSAAMVPATAMSAITAITQNWAAFATAFEPVAADKQAFAAWNNGTGGQFVYVCYDSDITATQAPGSFTGFGKWLVTNTISGCVPVYLDPLVAAFVLGTIASIDFTQKNGRVALAFKSCSGLVASVNDPTSAANLLSNGYNFYGAYATANQAFTWFYNGQISGPYQWIDSYVDAIWLNAALQLALMTLFASMKTIPYNFQGYALIEAACNDPITAALNAGVINPGVPPSASQIAQVNAAAGLPIDQVLATRGWYLQVLPASAIVRGNRQSPPCTLWYMDGGSVTKLNLASIDIH